MLNLVWCAEHCHKPEYADLRDDLAFAAEEYGADFVCLKRACKYADWVAQGPVPPFALVVSWREAKPCAQEFANRAMPFGMFVYCDTPQSYRRAIIWANTIVKDFGKQLSYMHVVQNIPDLKPLLSTAMKDLQSNPCREIYRAGSGKPPRCQSAWTSLPISIDVEDDRVSGTAKRTKNLPQGDFDGEFNKRKQFAPQCYQAVVQLPNFGGHDWAVFAPVVEPQMLQFLTAQCRTQNDWHLVEKLLVAALPDHYID